MDDATQRQWVLNKQAQFLEVSKSTRRKGRSTDVDFFHSLPRQVRNSSELRVSTDLRLCFSCQPSKTNKKTKPSGDSWKSEGFPQTEQIGFKRVGALVWVPI